MYEYFFSVNICQREKKMRRDKYIEDYEDFEPENAVWPFFLLSFLLPLIPFVMNIVLGSEGFTLLLLLQYITCLLPLFCTSLSVRDGERAWTILLSSFFYFALVLFLWASHKINGDVALPFALNASPSLLPFIAFTFFKKRKRNNWIGWAIIGVMLSALLLYFAYRAFSLDNLVMLIYPAILFLLSLTPFFVTRRTESTPAFVAFLLVLLVFASFTIYPSFSSSFLIAPLNEKLTILLNCFLYSFVFWYTLSFLFVFSGLAGKSSYKRVRNEEDENIVEEVVVSTLDNRENTSTLYTTPPPFSRYDKTNETRVNNVSGVREERNAPREDDKWYNFIEGGIRSDSRESLSRDDGRVRDRDYRDRGRRDYYQDERDRQRYRDDRDRYDDRRPYRDERDYYPRDRRESYYESERDYPPLRRGYERDDYRRPRGREYYDDDYPEYHRD